MSISNEAIIVGVVGDVVGLEYFTRALMAGYTLKAWREMFLRDRIISLATRPAGATRDTLRAESRGLIAPRDGSPLNDSSRFIPDGTWLGRYSSFKISVCTCSTGLRFAVAQNTTDGFCRRSRGLTRKADNFHTTSICPSPGFSCLSSVPCTTINGSSASSTESL